MITVVVYGARFEGLPVLVHESLHAVGVVPDNKEKILAYFAECLADQTEAVVMVYVGGGLLQDADLRRNFAADLQAEISFRFGDDSTSVQVVLTT